MRKSDFPIKSSLLKILLVVLVVFAQTLSTSFLEHANALVVTATGTNGSICNQTVTDATSVVAYRIANGDCVVEFRNIGSTTWTAPAAITSMSVLVVGGGGGGAARHSGGGGGGGVLYVTNYKPTANGNYVIAVGDGGAGAPGLTVSGGGRAGASSSFGGASGAGSIVANGGGGGGGGNDASNALNFDGSTNSSPARASGGGSNYESSPVTGSGAPGNAYDIARSVGTSTFTYNGVSATINAYAQTGAVGKGSSICYGSSATYTGWCGGGGGGASAAGASPTSTGSPYPWKAGKGGDGVSIAITGTATYYAGGGGGGSGTDVNPVATLAVCTNNSPLAGDGGLGGGGAGSQCINTATSGAANTGGGGGGGGLGYINGNANTQGVGGKGGSGIVILRYTPNTTTSIGSLTLSGNAYKGVVNSLTLAANTPGTVRFFMDGKRIANCISVPTTGSSPTYTATCSWKPAISSRHTLTAIFTPTDNSFQTASPAPSTLYILKRTTTR
jgi:hypothetical protein